MIRQITSKAPAVTRYLLGTIFFVFGLNGFLGFLPQPEMPPEAGAFLGALDGAGYMFPLIKGIEVLAGLLLLTNRLVPLALTILAPIVVNIVAFHAFLAPDSMAITIAVLAMEIYLAWSYRNSFRGVLAARAEPAPGAESARLASQPVRA